MPRSLSCPEVLEQLHAYLDREVDRDTNAAIDEHLADCRSCFSRTEFEILLRRRMAETATAPVPRRLEQHIRMLVRRL